MRVLITGANGFVGRQLVLRLLEKGAVASRRISHLLLLDAQLEGFAHDARLRLYKGNITDAALLRRVLADGIDLVFHLVSVPGGAAEQDYGLGYQVNLLASLELFDQLRQQARPPVLVYASSVAVYGAALPVRMDESAPTCPQLSYGAHKLMVETALCDLARRGEVDGRALRLPGIVARPPQTNGLRSAFMSDLLHAYATGQAYVCPVAPEATAWWMSARCCVDNLIHAAELPASTERVWQLPVLRLSIAQVLDALAKRFGVVGRAAIRFEPDAHLQALFGAMPMLKAPRARAAGFCHDGSAHALVRNALNLPVRRKTP
ncbi:Nucleoside-diphosphate-sugar epimerase [Pseudomonas sp. NFIX10]|uniref:NAD-dependent epimerase/dehydratase family protein n=1 Tax=unclassified Pseudomonas TaxID=196821 RepID=UPI0008EF3F59|nr:MULTISPECIES: NAD-dependent epimerase/dehydratase family protein [unclassified Pseudomonas]SFB38290.1 Nucleoside-diphosphate-sugar epimerase [Pseudomonas sp. NFIX10]SFF47183.1 Nucleoside-diphosphate-sugar epimerase [Pseudomonas sp. NFACC06-1]